MASGRGIIVVVAERAQDHGSPWPEGEFGEVTGPSGSRCFDKDRCATILGVSGRTVQTLVAEGKLEKDPTPVGQSTRLYLSAASVERLATTKRRWPPSKTLPAEANEDAWHELAVSQGKDLERTREQLGTANTSLQKLEEELRTAKDRLRLLEADNRDLRQAAASLGAVVGRVVPTKNHLSGPDQPLEDFHE
jgi:hypothetical protein